MVKPRYQDPQGRHIRVYATLLNSPAYRVIGYAAKALFFDLREKVNGTNNGNIGAALSDLKHKGWASSSTLAKGLYELRAMGFIAVTVEGGLKQGRRMPSLYRFTDLEVLDQPKAGVQAVKATHDFLKYDAVRDAERALAARFAELQGEGKKKQQTKKNVPVRISNPSSLNSELERDFSSSNSEHGEAVPVRKPNKGKILKSASKAP
jgi:hypothetical protein